MNTKKNIDREDCQVCPVCQVEINKLGQVKFSSGQMGSRARLYARVCQYVDKRECINSDPELIGEITASDRYSTGDNLQNTLDNTFK
ncbi:MAG: hypothetical protein ACFBSE_09040 [Prochloraceae cyanobacterium]